MCGIAGFVSDSVDITVLNNMLATLHHRGPDDTGTFVEAPVALGHARLSIVDLAGGHQPMTNEDGTLSIVFNGEIFNYPELTDDLIQRGHVFRTRSDTEVILHLFEEYGEACVARMNGQWAFAIWDRVRRRLFLSRDRLGVRPLFLARIRNGLVFASEIKALLQHPEIVPDLDLEALDQVLTFWHTVPPRTMFVGIQELSPGESAWFSGGALTVKPYWNLDYGAAPLTPCSEQEERRYGEELLALLTDAARIRLRADVPVGAYVSGGLDSTLVAALARPFVDKMSTFSIRFNESDLDEGPFQNAAVASLGTDHQEVRCAAADIGRVFPDVIRHTEKPLIRTAPAPLYLLAKLVRESGYKVVLTGEGADEILGGYDIFKEAKIRRFCAAHPSSRLRPLLLKRLYPYQPLLQSQSGAYLQAFFRSTPEDLRDPFFSHAPRWRLTARAKSLLSNDVKHVLSGHDPLAAMRRALPSAYSSWSGFSQAEYLEARFLLPGYILSSQGDRMAMAHSVEARFPYLDYRLVEFANRLPIGLKMSALTEKYLLKKVAANRIPQAIAHRHKQPYRAPDALSFFGAREADYAADLLSPACLRDHGVFDPAAVQRLVAKARGGNVTGVGENMAVVAVISTGLFMEEFIKQRRYAFTS